MILLFCLFATQPWITYCVGILFDVAVNSMVQANLVDTYLNIDWEKNLYLRLTVRLVNIQNTNYH